MPQTIYINLRSLSDTLDLGRRLGNAALPGDVILLEGTLGSGKTTLTQAIGQGLSVLPGHYITSPTFSLLHEYPGRIPLYHMDLYRLGDESEIEDLGFTEYLYGESDGVTVIEWPDRLGGLLPDDRLHIELKGTGSIERQAVITGYGESGLRLLRAIAGPSSSDR